MCLSACEPAELARRSAGWRQLIGVQDSCPLQGVQSDPMVWELLVSLLMCPSAGEEGMTRQESPLAALKHCWLCTLGDFMEPYPGRSPEAQLDEALFRH